MKPDTRALTKLKRDSSRWPNDSGFAIIKKILLSYMPAWLVVWVLRKYFVKSDFKAARESIKFFQLSNRAYGAGKRPKAQRLLMIALRLLGDQLPKSYISLLQSAVVATFRGSSNRRSISNSILLATKEAPVEIFDASSWYQLSRGLFSLGYFRAAWVARENSLDLSVSESTNSNASPTTLQRGIEALLERRDYMKANGLFDRVNISSLTFYELRKYVLLLQNLPRQSSNNHIPHKQESAKTFEDLLRDKHVVVVGPAHTHGEFGVEIDKADTVIRIKWTDGEKYSLSKSLGLKADMVYLGGGRSISAVRLLAEEGMVMDILSGIKLILTNEAFASHIQSLPVFVIENAGCCYRTPSTSGMRVLLAALQCEPRKLEIYGFDFYSTLTPYNQELTKFYQESSWHLGHPNDFVENGHYFKFARARDFSVHDPVSNFCFAQNLYKAGLFDIEPYGKSILELTPYQYVERLEEMLGDW